jgi:peptide/nickel transport system ATP-binding protein
MITHDLGVVAELSDDILVIYAGRVAEYGSAADIFGQPGHPYTWGLLASMPRMDRERLARLVPIPGTPPSLIRVPAGCPFHPRCRYGHLNGGRSETEVPELRDGRDRSPGGLPPDRRGADQAVGPALGGPGPRRCQGTGAARRR